jgi:hypothetical protein
MTNKAKGAEGYSQRIKCSANMPLPLTRYSCFVAIAPRLWWGQAYEAEPQHMSQLTESGFHKLR